MAIALICQGVLMTDERDLEDSVYGWYGQIGVLMVYANTSYLWFTFIFTVVLVARAFWQRHVQKEETAATSNKEGDYYAANDDYEAPEVTVT